MDWGDDRRRNLAAQYDADVDEGEDGVDDDFGRGSDDHDTAISTPHIAQHIAWYTILMSGISQRSLPIQY